MERSIFKYIWHHSRKEQLSILLTVLFSMPFYFISLDLPKDIVNKGIQGAGFSETVLTQPFLEIGLPFSDLVFGEEITLFDGFQLEQASLLLSLSFAFLFMVCVNGLFKFTINTSKGRMGERLLRRLRFELADRILRFPLPHLKRVKQAEMATMIKDEVEPLGGFIGDAFISPAFLGGQAITAMAFILVQSPWLGLVAAAIVLVQAFIIPRLRRRILVLGRERQITARQLAGRIGELVDGALEIRTHDASNYERADLTTRLGRIFRIRYEIFQRKFFVKFLNNFLSQFTPFIFYSVGGLLALNGRLDIGALVAVIAAYKDLPGPVKELIDWDQQRLDVQIKYDQVIDQFQPPDMLDPASQAPSVEASAPLEGEVAFSSVSLIDDNNAKLIDGASFRVPLDTHLAIVGPGGSGKEHLGLLLAGLVKASGGTISVGGLDISTLPASVTGRRLTYVGSESYHFPVSVRENLLYGLKHAPFRPAPEPEDSKAHKQWDIERDEDRRSGNPILNLEDDWVDYDAAGVADRAGLDARLFELIALVELEPDVYRLGLAGIPSLDRHPTLPEEILRARVALTAGLEDLSAQDLVDHFDEEKFNRNATLAENILFGTPRSESFMPDKLASNEMLLRALKEADLIDQVLSMGLEISKTMVELFAGLPPGHPFFDQFSFINEDDLPEFKTLVARVENTGLANITESDRAKLLSLPFSYVEARHRLNLIKDEVEAKIITARKRLTELLEAEAPDAVVFYRADSYNSAASLQDNILFGRLAYGQAGADETVGKAVTEVLRSLDLYGLVVEVGLDYNVGIGGKRLSSSQRQKLALARALLKRPDLLIVSEALVVMDGAAQERLLDRILKEREGQGLVWTLQRPELAKRFDNVVVLKGGRVSEAGTADALSMEGHALHALLQAQ